MSYLTDKVLISQTTISGAWEFNTRSLANVRLKRIICTPANSGTTTTTFDFYIKDSDDVYLVNTEEDDQKADTVYRKEVSIPVDGILTIGVKNASENEDWTGKLIYEEER